MVFQIENRAILEKIKEKMKNQFEPKGIIES